MKTALLFGGGLESALIFLMMVMKGEKFDALWFDYGQAANKEEMIAVGKFCFRYEVPLKTQRIHYMKDLTKNGSSLFGTSENHVVDGRNLFFIMEALKEYDRVVIGSHKDDTAPDAHAGFLTALQFVVHESFRGEKMIHAPLYDEDIRKTVKIARGFCPNLFDLIFSCWTPVDGKPCGVCKHCQKIEGLR